MRAFEDNNPIAVFIYFAAVASVTMFCAHPVMLMLSLAGAFVFFLLRNRLRGGMSHLFFLGMFAVMSLINPIFNHNGVTVLFVVNDNPITLEALLFGIAAAVTVISVIYWFRSFSQIMTGDRLLYVFGSVSPKLALLLSMTLRYIPLFGLQAKRVSQSQKALGLYREDSIPDTVRGGARVFSVMVSWALENGIITADSMEARGYGIGRRTFFSIYRFRAADAVMIAVTLAAAATALIFAPDFYYYPARSPVELTPSALISYGAFALLAFLPSLYKITEDMRWKFLRSKI